MSLKRLLTLERVVVVGLVFAALASGFYFAGKSGSNPDAYSNDFNVYYHAAREVLAGRDPYQHSLGDWTPYIYPPLLVELMVPLALLPLPVAAYVWFLMSAASVVAAAWMSAGLACGSAPGEQLNKPASWLAAVAACAIVLVLRFVLDTFNLGQVNSVVACLAVAHVYLYARDRKTLSAIALVIAISMKLTPALLLLYHITKLRLKFAMACGALLAAITIMSFLPFGPRAPDAFQTFWSRTIKNEQGYDFGYSGNQSLRGAITRLSGGEADNRSVQNDGESRKPSDPMTLLISIVLLALASLAAIRAPGELAAVAPFFCCMVLLSPLSWKAHYVILILPAAYLLSNASSTPRVRLWIAAALGAASMLFNLTSPRVIGLAAAEWADAHSLIFVGALLVFIACVSPVAQRGRT